MPFVARRRRAGVSGSNLKLRVPLGLAVTAAWLLSAAAVQAQQTVVIGGGPAPSGVFGGGTAGASDPIQGGIEVNDAVLDSLGPGPTGAVPLPAPQSPVARAPLGTSGRAATGTMAMPGETGAYRAPGSGELVVTRPSTLLYPPMESPRSRLTIAPTRRAQAPAQTAPAQAAPAQTTQAQAAPAQQAASGTGGKLKSRLIAAPPKQRAPEPAKSAAKPAAPKAPQTTARAAAPAKPSAVPAKPRLTEEIKAAEAPAVSGSIAPEPRPETASMPAPSAPAAPKAAAPKATAVAPPPPSSLTTPRAAATSAPKVPQTQAPEAPKAQTPEAPPPAPSNLIASQPKAVQEAARTTGAAEASRTGGKDLRLSFASGSAELSEAAKQELRGLAKGLAQDSSSRVQLLAYAADAGDGASRARRLSLSRALAVRAFLIDQGIRSTRMDVRALGSNAGDGPADRVDVLPQ